MIVTLTGATGLIGSALTQQLRSEGAEIRVLGRHAPAGENKFWQWHAGSGEPPLESLEGVDAIVNLAGEPIAQRWTAAVKQRLTVTRVDATRQLVNALSKLRKPPATLISASAIGYYGDRGDQPLTDESPPGNGFLPRLCVDWENEARRAEPLGIRVVRLRIGVALGLAGGALAQLVPIFKMGMGGPVGHGTQWMSWIHVEDLAGFIRFALDHDSVRGALNATSPNPVENREFTHQLGAALHRPALMHVPAFALKLRYGEMSEVLLASARVLPRAAVTAGFHFRFPELAPALHDLLHHSSREVT